MSELPSPDEAVSPDKGLTLISNTQKTAASFLCTYILKQNAETKS